MNSFAITGGALFHSMGAPLALVDDSFTFVEINHAFESQFGFESDELRGKSSLTIYDPATLAQVRRDRVRLQESPGANLSFERRIVSQSKRVRNATVRISSVRLVNDSKGYLLLFEDVHEASERERMLFSRHELFRLTIEDSPVPIAVQDQNFKLVLVNRALCEFVGYREEELLGRDPEGFLHPPESHDKIEFQREHVLGHGSGGRAKRISTLREAIHKDGRRIPYRLEYGASQAADGSPLWCSMLIDLSRQREAQIELRAQVDHGARLQNRFDTFANLTKDAVLVSDRESGRVIYANEAVLDVLGIELKDIAGQPVNALWSAVDSMDRPRVIKFIADSTDRFQNEITVQVNHEQVGAVSVRLRLFSLGGASGECFLLAEDISDKLRVERERIEAAVRQRDIFVKEIHHRIKNNLHGLTGLVQKHGRLQPQLKLALDDVAAQISAIAEIHGMQVNAEQPSGEQGLIATELFLSVARGLSRIFDTQLEMDLLIQDESTQMWLKESETIPMALVVNELLTNAIKHTTSNSPVVMTVKSAIGQIEVQIVNDGSVPAGFDPKAFNGLNQGLGLVNSLLPNRGADLSFHWSQGTVTTVLTLAEPVLYAMPGSGGAR